MLLFVAAALAHQPWIAAPGQYASAESPFPVTDIDLSIVVYDALSCDYPSLWLSFDATEGEELFVQIGMPVLDRQAEWRPSLALLAPGLPTPPPDLPFDVPAGLGAQVWDTTAVTEPTLFNEPFSGTSSWIVAEDTVRLPAGRGYLVAWDPANLTGKLWIASGTREEFDAETMERVVDLLDDLRAFHELDDAPEGELVACASEPPEDTAAPGDDADGTEKGTSGCATVPGAPLAGLTAMGAVLARRRRR